MTTASPRLLGQLTLIALGLNGVIGVGIFFVPRAVAAQVSGARGALIYLATALACTPIALAFARLGTRFKEDGGPYLYSREAFGAEAGFVVGWLTYVSAVISASAVIRGLAEALAGDGDWVAVRGIATGTTLVLVGVVAVGLRVTAWTWTAVTALKLIPLGLLVGAWLVSGALLAPSTSAVSEGGSQVGLSQLMRAGLLVLFALQGFEIVPVPAGHVRNPRSIARATVIALLAAAGLYMALHVACAAALPRMQASTSPLVDAARVYGGPWFGHVLYAGTSVSAFGIALGMMAMTPRYLSTLGRPEGLGNWLGQSSHGGVPLRAVLITAALVLVTIQVGSLDELFAMSSIAVLAQYATTSGALAVLGYRKKLALGGGDVALGLAALAMSAVVAAGASWQELVRAAAVVVVGVLTRMVISRWRRTRARR